MIDAPLLIRIKFTSDRFGKAGHYIHTYTHTHIFVKIFKNNGKLHNLDPTE